MQLKGKNNLLSIILPFHNEGSFLNDCIQSIRNQTFTEWELLAIDDHSTDKSLEIAYEHAQEDARIRVLTNRGKGLNKALQTGEEAITGNFISRMDADDLCEPNKYQLMMDAWQGRGTVVCGQVHYFSENQLFDGFIRYQKWLNQAITGSNPWQYIYQECVVPSPSWLMHRKDLHAIGGLNNGTYPEDYDLAFRMYLNGFQLISTTKQVHLWRDHPKRNSRTNEIYKNAFFPELKWTWFLANEMNEKSRLVLWGAGKRAKVMAQLIKKSNKDFRWITNNLKKARHRIYDCVLEHQDDYQPDPYDKIMVVVSSPDDRDILLEYLNELGLEQGINFWFFC